ncbi:MAG: ribbon-helix-helix protein, CopG family [Vicinamibacterales bacterium]
MAIPKVTFTLDEATVAALKRESARTGKPQSLIVREAIAQYEARGDRLTAAEQQHLLGVIAEIRASRTADAGTRAAREATAVTRARREGGRRSR